VQFKMSDLQEEVHAVIPPGPEDFDFDQIDCLPVGPDITIADDFELLVESGCPVLEITGQESKICFYVQTNLPLINFHIKNVDRYMGLSIIFMDDIGLNRTVNFSTKRSLVTVDKTICNLPIIIGEGWQFLCLDLCHICTTAFGTNYSYTTEIQVHGTCRLSKVFFTLRQMSDIELPQFLRVAQREN